MTKTKKAKSASMFPGLHHKVAFLLADDGLDFTYHNEDNEASAIQEYDTCIMGRFDCCRPGCEDSAWTSKKIAITIRMYSHMRYNAKVWHQRCRACKGVCSPSVDESSYADRIAYRLKKWSGVDVERPEYGGNNGRPHQSTLCEGCRAGHCTGSRAD